MEKNNIPSLIMAGGYDPVTPVYYSNMIRPFFSNAYFVEFPRTGHGVSDNSCGQQMVESFLDNFQDPIENPCFEEVQNRKVEFER